MLIIMNRVINIAGEIWRIYKTEFIKPKYFLIIWTNFTKSEQLSEWWKYDLTERYKTFI